MNVTLLIIILLAVCSAMFAAAGDYRTKATGNWNALGTWERHDGTNWTEPTVGQGTPTNSSEVITIRNPNTVTVTANVNVDQVTVEAGAQITVNTSINLTISNGAPAVDMNVSGIIKNAGTVTTTGALTFNNGGKYQHNWPGGGVGTIPTATWNDGSVCEIINMAGTGSTTKLQGTSQSFYDFVWNTPSQIQSVYLRGDSFRPIRHDFNMISTGSSNLEVSMVDVSPWRLDITNYNQTGGIFTLTRNVSGAPSYTMNISGDVNISAGTLTTGTYAAAAVVFNGTGTQTFSNTGGTLSGTINYTVNSGSTLDVGSSVITGTGSFTLQSGAGLITANANGIASSGASGSIQVTGTRTYSSGANYIYSGTGQTTGTGLPASVNNFSSANALTLTNSLAVNGTYTGTIASGTLTLDGFNGLSNVYMTIAESGNNISNFAVSTSVGSNMPAKIDRQWSVDGSYTGNKITTFYWNASEDNNYNWIGLGVLPSVYKGATEYTQIGYSVGTDPRWVIVSIPTPLTKGIYKIGPANDVTLPVELSSFSAILTSDFFVRLHWTTQSETGVSGFYIYRGTANSIASSIVVSPMIDATNSTDQHYYDYTDSELFEPGTYYYWLSVQNMDGSVDYHGPTTVYYDNSAANHGAPGVPIISGLTSVYPNPFNPSTTISYGLAKDAEVSFVIYNTRGQIVRSIAEGHKAAGNWKLNWNGKDNTGNICSTGIYFIKMLAGTDSFVHKVMLQK